MSVAQLGFAVDSSSLVGASKALNDLTAAAKPAARAAADLSKASTASATGLAASSKAAKESASSHAGLSSQAQAASHSIRSMVEQLASGVPPTQALTNQMNHLSYAASGPGGLSAAFSQAIGAFRGFLSPTTAKDVIAAQATECTKNGAQMDSLAAKARDFSQAWDKAITNLKFGLQGATLSGVSWLDGLSDAGTRALMKFNTAMHNALPSIIAPDQTGTNLLRNAMTNRAAGYQVGSLLTNTTDAKGNIVAGTPVDPLYAGLGTGAPGYLKPPADKNALQHDIQLYTPCLGMLGQTKPTAEESRDKPAERKNDNDGYSYRTAA